MQLADKLLEMRGRKIMGYGFALIAGGAFIGFLGGAGHQLAVAIVAAIVAGVCFWEG